LNCYLRVLHEKRWLLNLLLLLVVAGLVTFLYTRPKPETVGNSSYEVSSYKMAEFNAIKVEFPAKAPVTLRSRWLLAFNCTL